MIRCVAATNFHRFVAGICGRLSNIQPYTSSEDPSGGTSRCRTLRALWSQSSVASRRNVVTSWSNSLARPDNSSHQDCGIRSWTILTGSLTLRCNDAGMPTASCPTFRAISAPRSLSVGNCQHIAGRVHAIIGRCPLTFVNFSGTASAPCGASTAGRRLKWPRCSASTAATCRKLKPARRIRVCGSSRRLRMASGSAYRNCSADFRPCIVAGGRSYRNVWSAV